MEIYSATTEWLQNSEEFTALTKRHYEEVPYLMSPYDHFINYDMYRAVESQGNFLGLVMKEEDGHICAYLLGFVTPMAHNADKLVFVTTAFYTEAESRGKGCAKMLYSELVDTCKRVDIDYIHYTINETFPEAVKLVEALGMKKIETTYALKVGG